MTYDAVVIGAGPAGEACALALAKAGRRVAICEGELVAGECSFWACMPSKTLLRAVGVLESAKEVPGAREALGDHEVDARAVFAWRDRVIDDLDDASHTERLEEAGVEIVRGFASVAGPGRVRADGRELETERIVIATGSRAEIPPVDGLEALEEVWTNREGTTASEVPARLLVLGGGPVGCELAQAWARLGAKVTLVEAAERLLAKEPPEASARIRRALEEDGVAVHLDTEAEAADRDGDGYLVTLPGGEEVHAERILVAAGRRARTEGLGLESVGIEPAGDGSVPVDDRCRAAEGVWAIGDVTGLQPFTHVGRYQARIAVGDMEGKDVRASYRAIPRVTFTDPPVASVGVSEDERRACAGLEVLPRSAAYVADGRDELGFLLLFSDGEVLTGACAVGPEAGEWLGQLNLAVSARVSLEELRAVVQPFLTFSEIVPRTLARL